MAMTFGEKLKELRQKSGYSQNTVEKALGLARKALASYEKKIQPPSLNRLKLFADFFNVSMDYFLDDLSEIKPVPAIPLRGITDDEKKKIIASLKPTSDSDSYQTADCNVLFAGFALNSEQLDILNKARQDSDICGLNYSPEEIFQLAIQILPAAEITRLITTTAKHLQNNLSSLNG